jgi:hypothetical protein
MVTNKSSSKQYQMSWCSDSNFLASLNIEQKSEKNSTLTVFSSQKWNQIELPEDVVLTDVELFSDYLVCFGSVQTIPEIRIVPWRKIDEKNKLICESPFSVSLPSELVLFRPTANLVCTPKKKSRFLFSHLLIFILFVFHRRILIVSMFNSVENHLFYVLVWPFILLQKSCSLLQMVNFMSFLFFLFQNRCFVSVVDCFVSFVLIFSFFIYFFPYFVFFVSGRNENKTNSHSRIFKFNSIRFQLFQILDR